MKSRQPQPPPHSWWMGEQQGAGREQGREQGRQGGHTHPPPPPQPCSTSLQSGFVTVLTVTCSGSIMQWWFRAISWQTKGASQGVGIPHPCPSGSGPSKRHWGCEHSAWVARSDPGVLTSGMQKGTGVCPWEQKGTLVGLQKVKEKEAGREQAALLRMSGMT